MKQSLAAAALSVMALVASDAAARAQDPAAYCVPGNTRYDPGDLERAGAPPLALPPGVRLRRIEVAGFETMALEAGPQDSAEVVVFMHGNPGNTLDFLGILRSVPQGTRLVAFDLLGFGRAEKPWDFPFTLEASRPLIDAAFRDLGVERLHLVGHDLGSFVAVDWAARHPQKLASAVLIAGGLFIGYTDHHFARIWKTPELGEMSMSGVDREGFVRTIQAHNPRPLPREFLDRNYDTFDRATRCAVLRLYRAMPDIDRVGRAHARALRPHDKPALVIWGDRDPFVPQHIAYGNREGFPGADIRIFANSGHWPFVDEEQRTVKLMSTFLRRHVVEQAGAQLQLTVRPRRAFAGRRTRLRIFTSLGPARQPLAGATVRGGGRRARTDASGRATLVVRPRRRGSLRITAAKPQIVPAHRRVRVVGRPGR